MGTQMATTSGPMSIDTVELPVVYVDTTIALQLRIWHFLEDVKWMDVV
jgi:hypothetical protein